ncbi:DUF721 domain-containing protein [bacterium]|nr:DUF721 domain-containing protein [bacterium]
MKKLVGEIKNLAKKIGLKRHLDVLNCQREWCDTVGESVANETSIVSSNKNTLIISVNSSVWLNELVFLKQDILRKMKKTEFLKKYSNLRFVQRSENPVKKLDKDKKNRKVPEPEPEIKIPDDIRCDIKRESDMFKDVEISEKFYKLFENAYKARQRYIKNDVFMEKVCEVMSYLNRDPGLSYFDLNRKYGRYSVDMYYFALYNR